ncbi:glycoside hydrolase family 25 protein, partial [Piedraia hortae CBS 480.64]
ASSRVLGWDISGNQPNINAANAYRKGGMRFVYIKATEGLTYHNPSFSKQWTSTTSAGFIRGAYHFAHGKEDPVKQAQFFVAHGGKWSADGKTLPGALDLEGVNNSVCNGVTPSWVKRFSDEYHRLTKRYPVLYFSPGWWTQCMKGSTEFSKTNPLWLAAWGSNPPTKLPGGWKQLTIWQNKDTNKYGGDSDVYLHGLAQLKEFA